MPVIWVEGVGFGGGWGHSIGEHEVDGANHIALELNNERLGCPWAAKGILEGVVEGAWHCHTANNAYITAVRCATPRRHEGRLRQGKEPRPDKGGCQVTMSKDTMKTQIVSSAEVLACLRGGFIFPKREVVAIATTRVNCEQPLVSGQPPVFQGAPRRRMEVLVGMLGYKVVSPNLVGWRHEFSVDHCVP